MQQTTPAAVVEYNLIHWIELYLDSHDICLIVCIVLYCMLLNQLLY
jgi:hypothetical protein